MARRIASSRRRVAALARSMLARLAHATRRTSPTAPSSTMPAGIRVRSKSGFTATSFVRRIVRRSRSLVSGYCCERRAAIPSNSALTSSTSTPGFMRPLSHSQCWPRRSRRVSPGERPEFRWFPRGSTSSTMATGTHIWALTAGNIPPKLAGATPTTV